MPLRQSFATGANQLAVPPTYLYGRKSLFVLMIGVAAAVVTLLRAACAADTVNPGEASVDPSVDWRVAVGVLPSSHGVLSFLPPVHARFPAADVTRSPAAIMLAATIYLANLPILYLIAAVAAVSLFSAVRFFISYFVPTANTFLQMVRAVRWVHELWFGVSPLGDSLAAFGLYERFDVTSLSGHRQDIECLTLVDHHGTERIVSACLGGQIRIWDLEQHRCLMSAFGIMFNLPFYFINKI
jgi:hypothetical protein